jgi:hypothetical protein
MSSIRTAAACAAATLVFSVFAGGAANAQLVRHNNEGAIHFMLTPEYAREIGRVPNEASGSMEYFGGTVFSNVKVVSVIWGKGVDPLTVRRMAGFLKAIPNSTFQDQLAEYSTVGLNGVTGHKGSNQTLARGTFLGQYKIKPRNKNTTLQDKDIHVELRTQIREGNLPPEDANTLYMIYFPDGITIQAFGLTSCANFGAYHFAAFKRPHDNNIFYGVMPGCHYSFNSHTIISAHEFAEATTDNIPTPGTNPNYPQAWNTADGYEIGDLCEGTSGQLVTPHRTFLVQQVYLNSTGACSTGNYTSP